MREPFLKKKSTTIEAPGQGQELVLHPQHITDATLWKAFKAGDEKALITIFDRFAKPMYNYGYKVAGEREVVKDSVQELFIEIWQNRANLGETDSIKFYLFKSLKRKLIRTKAKSENRHAANMSIEHHGESSPSYESVLIVEQLSLERRQKIMTMLNTLTRRQHEAIFLRYFEELTCSQIAEIMDLSKQAVYNLIHHALDQLKKCSAESLR